MLIGSGVPTPALVVDRDAAKRNVDRAALHFRDHASVRLRPHFKAHKCTALLAMQLGAGACAGVTCATAAEAEVVARWGASAPEARANFARGPDVRSMDVLVANETAEPSALATLARAAALARLTVCVDDARHVALLDETAQRFGVVFDVLVEVDVGHGRCGVEAGSGATVALARLVAATPGLNFRGLQGYEGHAVLLPSEEARAGHVEVAAKLLAYERAALKTAGFACDIVSGGGTGTLALSTDAGALNEIQAGSYVLMDASYERLGLPFETALACRATVISRQGSRMVLDAGLKALSAEHGMPRPAIPGAFEIIALADEHATARLPRDSALAVGDPVLIIPGHVDPTVNLHAWLHAVGDDGSVERWAVDGRRS